MLRPEKQKVHSFYFSNQKTDISSMDEATLDVLIIRPIQLKKYTLGNTTLLRHCCLPVPHHSAGEPTGKHDNPTTVAIGEPTDTCDNPTTAAIRDTS